jgi:hypothetical protein
MSPTSTVVTLGVASVLSFIGYALIPETQTADLVSWKDLAGVSSATLMFGALIYVLRFVSTERAAAAQERRELADVNKEVAEKFSETTTALMKDFREDAQSARAALHDALREAKRIG